MFHRPCMVCRPLLQVSHHRAQQCVHTHDQRRHHSSEIMVCKYPPVQRVATLHRLAYTIYVHIPQYKEQLHYIGQCILYTYISSSTKSSYITQASVYYIRTYPPVQRVATLHRLVYTVYVHILQYNEQLHYIGQSILYTYIKMRYQICNI